MEICMSSHRRKHVLKMRVSTTYKLRTFDKKKAKHHTAYKVVNVINININLHSMFRNFQSFPLEEQIT